MPFPKHLTAALLLAASLPTAAQSRQETLLTSDWKFTKGDQPDGAKPELNDAKWQTVRIPHDWAIAGPFDGKNDQQVVKIEQNGEQEATLKSGRTGGLVPAPAGRARAGQGRPGRAAIRWCHEQRPRLHQR
ncbi:MAG: hypothetical protein EOO36_21040 [Cytophagaceae bacterium]|nr:MAG: hypothetical protein EOO36_21040 [Cytophagaceae bacterium]